MDVPDAVAHLQEWVDSYRSRPYDRGDRVEATEAVLAELEKLRKLKEKLDHFNPSLHDILMQEVEAGR